MQIKHTEEFDLAYRFVTETDKNIFLTGKAGTGKTTFLKYLRTKSVKQAAVAAPTGVAAINAQGVTLHSLFQLPLGIIIPEESSELNLREIKDHPLLSKIRYSRQKLELLRTLELLIIDETSMVPSYIVDAVDTILRYVRRKSFLPFGGVQVLFIGDLYQLPPVVKNEDWEILKNFYSSIFFFDSHVLHDNAPVIIELKEIFRQHDDKFIEVLNGIRNNNISEENFGILNSKLVRNFTPRDKDGYIILTTHNYQSDKINKSKLIELNDKTYTFHAEVKGEFPEHNFPAESELMLKKGAQVMFLKNDSEGKQYFNGKIGFIADLGTDYIKVKSENDPYNIEVKKCEWQNIRYKLTPETGKIEEEILGSFIQFPLRLAWAITIHKSQGLTFDKVIVDAERAFAVGQVYVALSRCTSLEGLILKSPVYMNFLGAHEEFILWRNDNYENNITELFRESRHNYIIHELLEIFSLEKWHYGLNELNEFLLENSGKTSSSSLQWLTGLMDRQMLLYETAENFKKEIVRLSKQNRVIEDNKFLQKRIKDGSNYFYNEINTWKLLFINHPLSLQTKKLSKKADGYLKEINTIIHYMLHSLSFFRTEFNIDEYLKSGKKFTGIITGVKSSYNKTKKIFVPADTPHPELYEMLLSLRGRISAREKLPFSEIFSNNAIRNVCENLPRLKHEVENLTGFGGGKGSRYGKEIASLVREYWGKQNINKHDSHPGDYNPRKKKEATATLFETIKLLNEGNCIEEIAEKRNFAAGTIESHLAKAIKQDLIKIEEVMPIEEVKKIAGYFPEDTEDVRLSSIKEKAPEEITYGKLRMVLAWLQKKKL